MTLEEAWELLGLRPDPPPAAVVVAWRRTRSLAHPDGGGDAATFHQAKEAYDEALTYALRQVKCPACHQGYRLVARGFGHVKLPCDQCNHTGLVARFAPPD